MKAGVPGTAAGTSIQSQETGLPESPDARQGESGFLHTKTASSFYTYETPAVYKAPYWVLGSTFRPHLCLHLMLKLREVKLM